MRRDSRGLPESASRVIIGGMDILPHPPVTLAILAGGEGRRMGMPKGALCIGDEPILAYLLRRWEWAGPTLLITAPGREHPPGCEAFNAEHVDPVAGEGPLRGLHTALRHVKTDLLVVATVDMPMVRGDQLRWLAGRLREDQQAVGMMLRRDEPDGHERRIEPFPCAFRRAALSLIERQLSQLRRSVHGLLHDPSVCLVDAPADWPAETWMNLNTPQDLRQFHAL